MKMRHFSTHKDRQLRNARSGGFTLAELLVVVAIIAVLVAIAIPVFSGSLEKSEEATCLSNRTSAQHALTAEYMVTHGNVNAAKVLKDAMGATATPDGTTGPWEVEAGGGICPAGGKVTIT